MQQKAQQTMQQKARQTKKQTAAVTARAIAAADTLHSTVQHVIRVLAAYADDYSGIYITDTAQQLKAAAALAEYAEKAAELLELHVADVLYSHAYSTDEYIVD
jgi:hypothetical protein